MKVTCLKCNRLIGEIEIDKNKRVIYKNLYGILSARLRLDGNWGFQCMCGNNSLLCEAEKGVIKASKPSVSDLKKVYENLRTGSPTITSREGDTAIIELFKVEGINGEI